MNPPLQETENIRPAFTSLAEIKSALKLMVPPVTEEHRTAFITNLSESPHSRQLAFRLLALLVLKQAGRLDKILSLLERELTGLLAGGMEHLPARLPDGSSEDVMLWVGKQFPSPATRQEAVEYLET